VLTFYSSAGISSMQKECGPGDVRLSAAGEIQHGKNHRY
jgi:hypothetical protein